MINHVMYFDLKYSTEDSYQKVPLLPESLTSYPDRNTKVSVTKNLFSDGKVELK